MGRYDSLVEQIKSIDTETVKSWENNNNPISNIIEEQKVYIWIRLYLKNESSNIEIGDDINMVYKSSGEKLTTKFVCYGKSDLNKDHNDEIINFNPEDDKKVLCLMVDEDFINKGDGIPFLRTLFKTSRHYEYQLDRRDDLIFINERSGEVLDYFDCDY